MEVCLQAISWTRMIPWVALEIKTAKLILLTLVSIVYTYMHIILLHSAALEISELHVL